MSDGMPELLKRAHREYSNKGLSGLVTNGLSFVARDFWLEKLLDKRSVSRTELQEIAAEDGKIWYMDEESGIHINPPSNQRLREEFKSYPTDFTPERPFVCELSGCHLIGDYAVGLTAEDRLVTETAPVYKDGSIKKLGINLGQYLRICGINKKSAERYEEDRVFPLVTPYSSYYHWVTEYLPKLRLLEYYMKETGDEPTILVESKPRSFVRESLEVMGYPPSSYKEWSRNEMYIDRLIVPLHRIHSFDYYKPSSSNYNPSRDDLGWLRQKVRSGIERNKRREQNKRIYISRQKTGSEHTSSRKVINYNEVEDVLGEFGFKSYVLEELSFQDQAELFINAEVIMGPHGAGLVNMIFSDDPLIIELFPKNKLKPHFYYISEIMGFEYEAVVSDNEGDDLVVDIDTLRGRLATIL